MPQEKPILIISLITRLREFNPGIGAFETSSLLKEGLQHKVILDNGSILIADELLCNYAQDPTVIDHGLLQVAANQFVPDHGPPAPKWLCQVKAMAIQKRTQLFLYFIISLLLATAIYLLLKQNTNISEEFQ